MSKTQDHKWKIGDWAEGRSGARWLIVFVDENGWNLKGVAKDRAFNCHTLSAENIAHLPDCTGWDWKPERKYRPFANDREFAPHFDRKVCWKSDSRSVGRIVFYNEDEVWVGGSVCGVPFKSAFEQFVFDDDGSPFGVEVGSCS